MQSPSPPKCARLAFFSRWLPSLPRRSAAQVIDLTIHDVGLAIGDKPLDEGSAAQLSRRSSRTDQRREHDIWMPISPAKGTVNGFALGTSGSPARIGSTASRSAVRPRRGQLDPRDRYRTDRRGRWRRHSGLFSAASASALVGALEGISIGGIGVGSGGSVRGIQIGGIGVGGGRISPESASAASASAEAETSAVSRSAVSALVAAATSRASASAASASARAATPPG